MEQTSKKVLIFLGPPGSGKGTQAKMIQKELDCAYISTGFLVRQRIKMDDELARKMKVKADKGIPQDDETILQLLDEKMKELNLENGIIFDAFPLSVEQAEALEDVLQKYNLSEARVIYIDIDLEDALERLAKRRSCPKCNDVYYPGKKGYTQKRCVQCQVSLVTRDDDKPEVIKKRFEQYEDRLINLKKYYQDKGILQIVDGRCSVEEAKNKIKQIIK